MKSAINVYPNNIRDIKSALVIRKILDYMWESQGARDIIMTAAMNGSSFVHVEWVDDEIRVKGVKDALWKKEKRSQKA